MDNLKQESIEFVANINKKQLYLKLWKKARTGILIFCGLHLIFELTVQNNRTMVILIWINYIISAWIIKNRIGKGKLTSNPLMAGFLVALIVFAVRLLLGTIIEAVFYLSDIKI